MVVSVVKTDSVHQEGRCATCSSFFSEFCIEKEKNVSPIESCEKYINKEMLEAMCDLMCPGAEDE